MTMARQTALTNTLTPVLPAFFSDFLSVKRKVSLAGPLSGEIGVSLLIKGGKLCIQTIRTLLFWKQ